MKREYAIGIDVGGTNTVFGIVDRKGHIMTQFHFKTHACSNFQEFLDHISVELFRMIESVGGTTKINGIGIGAPNANYHTGCTENPPNLPWEGITPVERMFAEKFNLPVKVTNDANVAAMGEMAYGAARGMKDFIVITLGTGVGGGIVVNGQVLYGADGFAGELGHTISVMDGRRCACGKNGCLEAYASAIGVVTTAKEFLADWTEDTLLRDFDMDTISPKDICEAALKGDKLAKKVFDFTGNILGIAFSNFVAFSCPEAIILFGGLAKSGDLLLKPAHEAMEKYNFFMHKNKVKLLVSDFLENDAAILGASVLGWEVDDNQNI